MSLSNSPNQAELNAWFDEKLPPHEATFTDVVEAYLAQTDRRQFLRHLAAYKRDTFFSATQSYLKLAETLLLFTPLLDSSADKTTVIQQAYRHYIINTQADILDRGDADTFDVFEWAKAYAAMFHIELVEEEKEDGRITLMTIDGEPIPCEEWGQIAGWSAAWSLRQVGRLINETRYGRPDVIPSHLFPFDPTATDYRKVNALWLSDLSNLVYRQWDYVKRELSRFGLTLQNWIEVESTDTQAFVAANDACIILSFRGTKGFRDIATDLTFFKADFFLDDEKTEQAGKVHIGFANGIDAVRDKVQAAILALQQAKERPLFITGHSLGGALAQLGAIILQHHGHAIAGVYTYGAPRVGNADFAAQYDTKLGDVTHVHINNHDIVPRALPTFIGFADIVRDRVKRFDIQHNLTDEAVRAEPDDPTDDASAQRFIQWANDDIAASNKYLETKDLTERSRDAANSMLYGAEFNTGSIPDHMIAQYLFKFACSLVDDIFESVNE